VQQIEQTDARNARIDIKILQTDTKYLRSEMDLESI
jgi:hypothetical protein